MGSQRDSALRDNDYIHSPIINQGDLEAEGHADSSETPAETCVLSMYL
jgi:hypothetical protein